MTNNHTEVKIAALPTCNVGGCEETAAYDAKSIWGSWGYFCDKCWITHTNQELGLGKGQRLILDS